MRITWVQMYKNVSCWIMNGDTSYLNIILYREYYSVVNDSLNTTLRRNKSSWKSFSLFSPALFPDIPSSKISKNELCWEETRLWLRLSSTIYKLVSALTWIIDHLLPLFRPWFRRDSVWRNLFYRIAAVINSKL